MSNRKSWPLRTNLSGFTVEAVAIAVLVSTPSPSYAYLDPGAGGMILQLLLGGIAGLMLIGKFYWRRLKDFCSGIIGRASRNSFVSSPDDNQVSRLKDDSS